MLPKQDTNERWEKALNSILNEFHLEQYRTCLAWCHGRTYLVDALKVGCGIVQGSMDCCLHQFHHLSCKILYVPVILLSAKFNKYIACMYWNCTSLFHDCIIEMKHAISYNSLDWQRHKSKVWACMYNHIWVQCEQLSVLIFRWIRSVPFTCCI